MKKIGILLVMGIILLGTTQLSYCASASDNATVVNESVKFSYSEVTETSPISLSKVMSLQAMSSEDFPPSHSEAIELANDYLNTTLGSDFVKSNFEVLGIDEMPDIRSIWFVVYKYESNGYEINLSTAVDISNHPEDPSRIVKELSHTMEYPQEIKLSPTDAETIASEKGLTPPYSTGLYWHEKRIAWVVTHPTKTIGEISSYVIDAENGEILGELRRMINAPPPSFTQEIKDMPKSCDFVPYSEIRNEVIEQKKFEMHATSSSDIYIESVSVLVRKITVDDDVTIEISSKNDDTSTHKLYHKLIITAPDGKVQTSEGSHLDVPSGQGLHTTFTGPDDFCGLLCPPVCENCGIGNYAFDVELWEDISLWPDTKHDSKEDDYYYRVFERPAGVSTNYYCDDSWHHPSNKVIFETALQHAAGAKTPYDAANNLKRWIYPNRWGSPFKYNNSAPWGARSSDLDVLKDKEGDCNDFGDLYVGLTRSINIPSRIVYGNTYNKTDPKCEPSPTHFCGVFCNEVDIFWGHLWAESYYTSSNHGIAFHHVDPTWDEIENPSCYKSSHRCISHIQASAYTKCSDNYIESCNWARDEITCTNGFVDVTTSTDGGYDSIYYCPSDIDSNGICDNFDPDKDGDGILNDPDPCPCWWTSIISPTTTSPASAGAFDNPSHIDITVEVKKGTTPVTGLANANFSFKIGGKTATASLTDTSIPGTYKFDVTPPTQVAAGKYDLETTVTYNWCSSTDTAQDAVEYTSSILFTYTLDADFDQGELVGLEHDTVHDQLQLTTHVSTDPIMWIANAGEDTISKWDTENNVELARYHTWFGPPASHGAWDGPSPSRTAVDADGNGYVANRHFDGRPADVIKILAESWIDRNGNGVMDTSYDANNDGRITPDEMLPMTDTNGNGRIDDDEIQDERIAWVVSVGPANGLGRSLAIDTNNNIWLGLYNTRAYYKISGVDGNILAGPIDVSPNTPYGALVDKNGILWGASLGYTLLKLDTNSNTKLNVYDHSAYGYDYGIALGYDGDGNTQVYKAGYGNSNTYIEFDSTTETFSTPAAIKYSVLGIATDSSGNIIASNYYTGAVTKFAPDGSVIWSAAAQVSSEARGTVVDSDDNIWIIHRAVSKLSKFDGSDGTPLGVFNTGLYPYTYSDATGLSLRGSMGFGTWTVIYDSESAGTSWGRVSWNSDVPAGADIDVQIRTGETEEGLQLATYQPVSNGNDFSATGRYIQIKTRLTASPTKESPILYDLTVEPATESSISGTKFNDINGNGIRDMGESGVSDVSIRLIRMLAPGVESFVSSTTTDGNGYYSFMGLQPGAYKIEEELSGFARSQTFPADGSPHYINFEGTAIEGLDFGNQPVAGGEIRGTKFNDSNGNGVQDIGELGISGVKICLWPSSRYTTTDESGNYIFPDVPVSTQTVYEIVPSGYASTTPTMVSVTVNTGEVKVVNFGNRILIPPPSDITVSGATVVDGVPQVFNVNPVVIQKDLAGISNNVVAVKLTLEWGDGTTMTMDMAEIDNANIWQATFSPPFPQGAAQMTFEVDVDPAGNWPGPEDAIQIGDIVFLDPSGQIIDTCTDNPIDGATVTLLVEFPPTSGTFIESPPGNQLPPTNPQITGADGMYGWMTVPGNYKVRAEKAGYISAESDVVNIPPAVTGLDIGLACINQPPVAIDKEVNTDEDTPLLGINVLTGCTDPNGDTLSVLGHDDTSTTGLVTFNIGDGTFDYDPDDQFEYLNSGETATDIFTFTISDGKGGTDTATVTITINGVNDAPEISLSSSMGTIQYSDGIEEFTISATDVDSSSLTLSTSWTKDGGAIQPDLPADLTLSTGSCNSDGPPVTCTWIIDGRGNVSAGTYNITINVNDGADESEMQTTLIVEPENAACALDSDNPVAIQVATPEGNSETFSLKVDVTEALPDLIDVLQTPYPGDISLAEVSMSLVPVGPGSTVESTSCLLEVVGTDYDAILTATCAFNDVPVNTYAVQVTVNGGCYTGTGEDVVVIYDPSLGFTTGGGTFLWPGTEDKTNFGYTMKYNKKATNIKGNLLMVRHLQDGTIYRVKSNALYGLALGESEEDSETFGWASFSGKSTYLEPGWGEPIGNHEFITYVEDHGEPGKNIDRIWIKVMNQGNTIDVMSMDDPGANNAVVINGGNIVVPHK